MFYKTTEYSLRLLFFLDSAPGESIHFTLDHCSETLNIPRRFLGKLISELVKENWVKSLKGPGGGICLHPKSQDRPLSELIQFLEGEDRFTRCAIGLKKCSDKTPCPLHDELKASRDALKGLFVNHTLRDYSSDLKGGKTILYDQFQN